MVSVDAIIAFESGEQDFDDTIDMIQEMVNDGSAWSLQGSYGRLAADFINEGLVTLPDALRSV